MRKPTLKLVRNLAFVRLALGLAIGLGLLLVLVRGVVKGLLLALLVVLLQALMELGVVILLVALVEEDELSVLVGEVVGDEAAEDEVVDEEEVAEDIGVGREIVEADFLELFLIDKRCNLRCPVGWGSERSAFSSFSSPSLSEDAEEDEDSLLFDFPNTLERDMEW